MTGWGLLSLVSRFGLFRVFLTGKVVESIDASEEMSSMILSSSKGLNGAGGCSYVASGGGSTILGSCAIGSIGLGAAGIGGNQIPSNIILHLGSSWASFLGALFSFPRTATNTWPLCTIYSSLEMGPTS